MYRNMRTNGHVGLTKSQSPRRSLSSQFVFPKYSHDNLGVQTQFSVYQGAFISTRADRFSKEISRDIRPLSSSNSKNDLFKQLALKAQKEKQTPKNNVDIQQEYYDSNTNKQNNPKAANTLPQRLRPTLKGRLTSSKSKQRYIIGSGEKNKERVKIRFNRVEQKKREEQIDYVRTSDGGFQMESRIKQSLDMRPDL